MFIYELTVLGFPRRLLDTVHLRSNASIGDGFIFPLLFLKEEGKNDTTSDGSIGAQVHGIEQSPWKPQHGEFIYEHIRS